MAGLLRSIVESEEARKARNEAESKWSGAETAWEALTLILAYDPEFGTVIGESGKVRTFVWQGARSTDMPDVQVIYEDNDPYLEVIDLRYKTAGRYARQRH